jgi:hypothetical protein
LRPDYFRGGLAALFAIALAGCISNVEPPRHRVVQAPPPGPPRAYVDVGLAGQAVAFEAYTRKASAIDASFSGPGEIGEALQTAAAYEPRQLEASMVAYAAMAALQEPAFVAGVRAQGRGLAGRIAVDPAAAIDLPGGPAAAARANAALARRGEALAEAGRRVKQAAYSVQHQPWSRARVPNAAQRLAAVERTSAGGYRPDPADHARLTAALADNGRRSGSSPVIERGLAVAALTALGDDGAARSLMREPRSGMCLREAKLNFHQCLASAGTHYEDIYCLGLHAMADPGQCVVDATRPAPMRRASLD